MLVVGRDQVQSGLYLAHPGRHLLPRTSQPARPRFGEMILEDVLEYKYRTRCQQPAEIELFRRSRFVSFVFQDLDPLNSTLR